LTSAATSRHPALGLLARYGAVFRAAWAQRHELAGPKRLTDETAFLPAALSLQETPVHPAPRSAAWVIIALFAFAVGWAIVGEVDIVAVAPGRIVVSDNTKLIQPAEAAVIKAIRVRDGDRVEAGQVLVELDATVAGADLRSVQEQLDSASAEVERAQALLHALGAGALPSIHGATPRDLARSEWSDISAKLAKFDAEFVRRKAELATAIEVQAKLQATLPLVLQREADYQALTAQGFVAGHAGQDRTRERIEVERDLATQQARIVETQAALQESRNAHAAYLAETRRVLSDRLEQARLRVAQLEQERLKSVHRERLSELRAPVAGTVQQLAVHTTGGVVTPAQPLMVIVPGEAEVTAEVAIANKDIGFVQERQEAQIKVDAFPFTRYGTVAGTVAWVAGDAVADDKTGDLRFPATVRLSTRQIDVDGKAVSLAPGLAITAEIKTGRRRLIEYVFSPIQRHLQESSRER
jgi:hemolysin D